MDKNYEVLISDLVKIDWNVDHWYTWQPETMHL